MITRTAIVEEARAWVGTPWKHQHSLKGVASDCIGLVRGVARGVGFNDPFTTGEAMKFAGYGRRPEPRALLEACSLFLVGISLEEATLADILLFRFKEYSEDPMHFAIISCLSPKRMIHGHARARKVAENGIDEIWHERLVSAWRYKELA